MKRLCIAVAIALLPLASFGPASAANPLYGHNLIVNGNAEAGAGLPGAGNVPGWAESGTDPALEIISVQYGYDGYPNTGSPGPKQRGTNFFSGGTNTNTSNSAYQTVDVSSAAADIDAQIVHYALAGYLGGYANQADYATLSATFRDASNTNLGSVVIGPVTQAQRKGVTGLWSRSTTGILPAGTRHIGVEMFSKYFEGASTVGSDDGYLDNLSLVLTKKKH